ncbi:MAG: hypothetical protein JKP95_03385 [Oceanicaulis sp.]|nr:hypothetical protein [Oceanicaulis sp.]
MKIAVIRRAAAPNGSRARMCAFSRPAHDQLPIAAALETGLFDHVIVSTDDDEIAQVAEAAGATAPFRRPPELADDFTGVIPSSPTPCKRCSGSLARAPSLSAPFTPRPSSAPPTSRAAMTH